LSNWYTILNRFNGIVNEIEEHLGWSDSLPVESFLDKQIVHMLKYYLKDKVE
jgi:hypothetical protein